jgi:hypothetical protein
MAIDRRKYNGALSTQGQGFDVSSPILRTIQDSEFMKGQIGKLPYAKGQQLVFDKRGSDLCTRTLEV